MYVTVKYNTVRYETNTAQTRKHIQLRVRLQQVYNTNPFHLTNPGTTDDKPISQESTARKFFPALCRERVLRHRKRH